MKPESVLVSFFLVLRSLSIVTIQARCSRGCDRALASYYVLNGSNLTFIAQTMQSSLVDPTDINFKAILDYNDQIPNKDSVLADTRINIPFPCDCINGEFLGHVFHHEVNFDDTYEKIASRSYANLTTGPWLESTNSYPANNIPDAGTVNVTINCSCGDASVSRDYGLFITYPLRPEDNLTYIASNANLSESLLQNYNPGVNFGQGSGLVFIPGRGDCFLISKNLFVSVLLNFLHELKIQVCSRG